MRPPTFTVLLHRGADQPVILREPLRQDEQGSGTVLARGRKRLTYLCVLQLRWMGKGNR